MSRMVNFDLKVIECRSCKKIAEYGCPDLSTSNKKLGDSPLPASNGSIEQIQVQHIFPGVLILGRTDEPNEASKNDNT